MANPRTQTHRDRNVVTRKRLTPSAEISEHMVAAIIKRLEAGKPVRRRLPSHGYLHLDRQVPFLLVYRRPARKRAPSMEHLLRGEASYIIADARRRFHCGLVTLVSAIAESLAESFGAFLVIETWSDQDEAWGELKPVYRPAFSILTEPRDAADSAAQTLEKALGQIEVQRAEAQVMLTKNRRPWPKGLRRLIEPQVAKRIGCHSLGLAIRPVFQDPQSGEAFPLIQRALHRGLGRAIRRAVFTFTRDQTSQRPAHFHALGPRSLVKLVWQVDRELAEIADDFDFLLCVTPTNGDSAWNTFRRHRFAAAPDFIYRPLPVDPALVKRQLYRIPIEKIEDPALEALFRAQQAELDRKLTMLGDRGTRRFLYGSLQLYGKVDAGLLQTALEILQKVPVRRRGRPAANALDARAFAARAEQEIRYYREKDARVWSRVEIRDDVLGVLVSQGNLLIDKRQKFSGDRVEALLAHEVGTHILTYFNGQAQPFRQLHSGLPDYEELQEGLAVLAEYLTGGLTGGRSRMLAARVLAAMMVQEGADFPEVFRTLHVQHGFAQKAAFRITLRVFRGGGLLKDMIYLRGLNRVLDHLGNGGAFQPLLVGKFGADHLPIIRELQWRKVLAAPALKPRYLENTAAAARLEQVRQGVSVLELIERR